MRRGRRSFTPSFEQLESRLALSTYYVATTGNDTAAGTSTAPWLTLQHGVDTIKAGDTIIVKAGTYAGARIGNSGAAWRPQPGRLLPRSG